MTLKKEETTPKKKTTTKAATKPAKKTVKAPAAKKTAVTTTKPAAKTVKTVKAAPKTAEEILKMVLKCLEDGKAEDIVTIPLAGKTSIADYMVIASGTSSRQVAALSEHISLELKKAKVKNSIEGKSGGQWVIVDALDVIVHIFYPETRNFYALEEMWNNLPTAKK